VYVHNRHWEGETLRAEATERIDQSAAVLAELMKCSMARTYPSSWTSDTLILSHLAPAFAGRATIKFGHWPAVN
jgi:hypothetical protein